MKKYVKPAMAINRLALENGVLAASKDSVFGQDTRVSIDYQAGSLFGDNGSFTIDSWD